MILFTRLENLPASLPCSQKRRRELEGLKNGEVVLEKRGAEALLWLCFQRRFPGAACPFDYPRTKAGRPYFPDTQAFYFSLSHTKGYALCAAFSSPCGADIEQVGRLSENVIAYAFHKKERAYLASLSGEARAQEAAKIWCLREAYAKRLGTGLPGLGKDFFVLPSGETSAQGVQFAGFLLSPALAAAVCATERMNDVPEEIRW